MVTWHNKELTDDIGAMAPPAYEAAAIAMWCNVLRLIDKTINQQSSLRDKY